MPTAIVLGGGGSLGDFQVGALQYLYEYAGIRPQIICGSSVGAINGAALAEGEGGIKKLEKIWLSLRSNEHMYLEEEWFKVLADPKVKEFMRLKMGDIIKGVVIDLLVPFKIFVDAYDLGVETEKIIDAANKLLKAKSIYNLSPIERLLRDNVDHNQIKNSGIKLRLAVVGLESGKLQYVDESGKLLGTNHIVDFYDAVLASAAIPAVFPPKKLADENFVDGNVREGLPIQEAIKAGADLIYAIACTNREVYPDTSYDNKTIKEIALRTAMDIMRNEVQENEISPPGGWGVEIKLIHPEYPLHDGMTIDPGLIRISMAYGYMRADDTISKALPGHIREGARELTKQIIGLRYQIWELESHCVNWRLIPGTDLWRISDGDAEVLFDVRAYKQTLKELVVARVKLGAAVPGDIITWWEDFEEHHPAPVISSPWAEVKYKDHEGNIIRIPAAASPQKEGMASPILTSPPNGQQYLTNQPREVTLAWTSVPNAIKYRLHVEHLDNEWKLLWESFYNTTSTTITFNQAQGRWHVQAYGIGGESDKSPPSGWFSFAFSNDPPLQPPKLLYPIGGEQSLSTAFGWEKVEGATSYFVEIESKPGEVWSVFHSQNTSETYIYKDLGQGRRSNIPARWRVTAIRAEEKKESNWQEFFLAKDEPRCNSIGLPDCNGRATPSNL